MQKSRFSRRGAAPVVVSNQAKNKPAIAWAYNNGIMIGDDGVNLRLEGNLSRAEAAALIVRARETDFSLPNQNFVDVANAELLKRIFESFTILPICETVRVGLIIYPFER